ncbi:DUF6197 family protein [Streptomyces sp. NRRL F-5650]|uniref:DUF6197 family protein n=1 Tax=Streptomyces sp. NRRL F-5650 TaxID=1463868 RepID=UPI0018FF03E2|nr:hypothetical protein [Streptomyces sp. NRRL F-5650]
MPATWATPAAARRFVEAVRDVADWASPATVLTEPIFQAIDEHHGSVDGFDGPRLRRPPYTPTDAEIADLLSKALTVLITNGWYQGDASSFHDVDQEDGDDLDSSDCRVCARGAINIAAAGDPRPPIAYQPSVLAEAATDALAETLGVDDVTVWNDAPGRTASALHDAVTRTIDRLRGTQATHAPAPHSHGTADASPTGCPFPD